MTSDQTPAAAPNSLPIASPDPTAPYPSYPYPYDYTYAYPYPYPAPGYSPWMYAPAAPRLSAWALASMICGIVSLVIFQPIVAVLAIIFGFVGMNEVKKSAGQVEGHGMAMAGVVTGFIAIGITLLFIALYIVYIIAIFSAISTLPD